MKSPCFLKGKTALVTGASQGIGRATAETLASCGADIIINHFDPNEEMASEVANHIQKLGRRAWVIKADLSSEPEVGQLFSTIRSQCDGVHLLVNNAGISQSADIFEMSLSDWRLVMETNLTSCFLVSKRMMELMRDQALGGRIVIMSSMVAHQGAMYGQVHYAASKSGMLGFTKTLARTGAPLGINVNAVAPGIIDTPLLFRTHGEEGVRKLAATVPLGLGKPEDVGHAVAFLCSDEARYITGTTIDVNGGMYLR